MDDLTLIARSKRRPIDDDTRSESGALEAADDDAYTRKCKLSYILIFPYPCNTYFNRPLILKKKYEGAFGSVSHCDCIINRKSK